MPFIPLLTRKFHAWEAFHRQAIDNAAYGSLQVRPQG